MTKMKEHQVITEDKRGDIIIYPYGETHRYEIRFGWSTGPMKKPGMSIAREDSQGRYAGGCIPTEDVDKLISKMCKFRGYPDPVNQKVDYKYPKTILPAIL